MVEKRGSSLDQILTTFTEQFNQNNALIYLVQDKTIKVCFETKNSENYYLFFENSIAQTKQLFLEDQYETVTIIGEEQIIREIISGKQKLRQAISSQNLTVSATFRAILLLESIFFLTNPTQTLRNDK